MNPLVRLIDAAVQREVFSGRRIGVNVSGGLDSSTVACLARRWNDQIPMFTGYYDVPGYDERRYAAMAASRRHSAIKITPRDFVDHFDTAIRCFARPWQGPGMFGQWMVGKRIKERGFGLDAVLSGEGADELFGGYARGAARAGMPMPDGYENYQLPPDYPEMLEDALDHDYKSLPLLLAVDDAALGAHGMKGVAPFTDPAVVEYALKLHPLDRVNKRHLREAVRGIVPDPIIDRTDKMGFPTPFVVWANEKDNPVQMFIRDRLGYIPDPAKPYDRGWWNELCDTTLPKQTTTYHWTDSAVTTTTTGYVNVNWPPANWGEAA